MLDEEAEFGYYGTNVMGDGDRIIVYKDIRLSVTKG